MNSIIHRLHNGELGETALSILHTCQEIADIDQKTSRQEINTTLKEYRISKRKWSKLCKVGRDIRLEKYSADLPCSITALYALTTLTNDELNDGMTTGDLHKSVSNREIYAYARECRLRSEGFSDAANIVPCYIAMNSEGEKLNRQEVEGLLKKINKTLTQYGLMILLSVATTAKFDERQKQLINLEKKQSEIETEIEHWMYMASDELSRHYSLERIDDIMEGSMSQFVNALLVISKGRAHMMQTHGTMYCYKIALEYYRATNRVQKYNYKRRLIHVQQKYKFLSTVVDKIFDELIERPKK